MQLAFLVLVQIQFYIDGDLYVSGSTDTGNKGRLASRFSTADNRPKPFDLKHPSKEGYRLRYACIEGPEVGVYVEEELEERKYKVTRLLERS